MVDVIWEPHLALRIRRAPGDGELHVREDPSRTVDFLGGAAVPISGVGGRSASFTSASAGSMSLAY
jgi:hypothetical protein